ncbi:MAG: GAF domain-containing sensor histidine kinase, partial [Candidatus Omnitrophica bacterium]|nr:GAF domain-containing sensor histidine kinase [Candidatus Omnitrophota bacterium]
FRKEVGIRKNQIKYFFLATIVGYGGGATCFLPVFGIDIYPYLNFTVPLYPLIMAYAIVKYQLMDIKVAVTRAGIFLIVYTFVLGVPFWVGYRTQTWFIPTFFMFVLATVGPLIYRFLQKKAENVLLAQQKHYQKILLQSAKGMVKEHDLGKLLKLIVYVVKRAVKIEFAALFLEDKEKKAYTLRAVRDHQSFSKNLSYAHNHELIKFLKRKKTIIDYEEINPFVREVSDRAVHLIVPTFSDDRLVGFLVLGEKENRTLYTEDDINVFNILSHQAALAIESCLFFEEFKKAQEKIFLAEKLASIGGMADGVAHQIKNRLNHFSIASGEMQYEIRDYIKANSAVVKKNPPLKKTFNYLSELAESLVINVKRTDGIIKGILNYARTTEKDTFFSQFALQEIIDLALELLRVKHEIAEFPLAVEIKGDDTIYGVKAQLLEALYNILDNGYEATLERLNDFKISGEDKGDFTPKIILTLSQQASASVIEISDNGMGVKEEDKQKIFAPFFTTKSSYKSGTGIGMYVVKRLIEENHKGKVTFKTKYKEGTKFHIRLPRK